MIEAQESASYQFHLLFIKVHLTVKFPCRMSLRYEGQKISDQVSSTGNSEFLFNQEIVLKDTAMKGCFEIATHLSTEKGNQIMAGIMKIDNQDLIHHRGQTLNFGLSNCLDSNAKCLIKVEKARPIRVKR